MDLRLNPEEQDFRDRLRAWLADELPKLGPAPTRRLPDTPAELAALAGWQRRLAEGGWLGLTWPREYGGQGQSYTMQAIFNEELARAGAPQLLNVLGLLVVGPTLITCGTGAQKARYLGPILSADEIWCQGFSEPGSGSDLASLRTRAVLEGDELVVTGQKVWTSLAQFSRWCLLLARTDPNAPKHQGISALIVDVRAPGITIRPLRQMTGHAEFNEVYFDDVRVPKSHLIGALNDGWRVTTTALMFERLNVASTRQVVARILWQDLATATRTQRRSGAPILEDSSVRRALARAYAETEVTRLLTYRSLSRVERGGQPGPEGSLDKLYQSEVLRGLGELAVDLLGPAALVEEGDPRALDGGRFAYEFLRSRAYTIAGGTSEIQRNIIAERILGLPRS